ncbi:hypothetical protein QQ045_023378 [Rhodiola kirilowii]
MIVGVGSFHKLKINKERKCLSTCIFLAALSPLLPLLLQEDFHAALSPFMLLLPEEGRKISRALETNKAMERKGRMMWWLVLVQKRRRRRSGPASKTVVLVANWTKVQDSAPLKKFSMIQSISSYSKAW